MGHPGLLLFFQPVPIRLIRPVLFLVLSVSGWSVVMLPRPESLSDVPTHPLILWIDRVGGFLIHSSPQLTLGRVGLSGQENCPDVSIQANLSTRHLTISRNQESYLLDPHSACQLDGQKIAGPMPLYPRTVLKLRNSVELLFRQPTRLSLTATLQLLSTHRFNSGVDGVVLMEQVCLLGAEDYHHIHCPDWRQELVLFRQRGEFFCQRRHQTDRDKSIPVPLNETVRLGDSSFRLEPVE